ncbi:ATP-binding protein [Gandjariella thermophila]|nr:LuxR C-terminal-related transcriptional regulator [Gandjariella thermophila]
MRGTLERARQHVTGLPADTTSFVGRRREIDQVRQALTGCRLLTLTGPGGVGKTRLALRVAARLRRAFPDGVCLVELAELHDPALLANLVAERLGLRDQSARAPADTVIDHLHCRRVLLVLDNCEHLVETCAAFVDTLVRNCPELRVLATSRQSLQVSGERVLTVPPLPVPDPDAPLTPESLGNYESVDLFVDRAVAVHPAFTVSADNCAVLGRLCRRLDGIPLAIELAARRLLSLSLEQIEERLGARYRLLTAGMRTAPTRQRTLQALIDWSYDLCTEREQLVWRRSSVFSGSFDLDAAEHVCSGDDLAPEDVLPAIGALVDKSVLLREDTDRTVRYRLLETIREYGQERLAAAGEREAVRRRHQDWYARLTQRWDTEWPGPDQVRWVERLRREHANLRVALDYCATERGEAATGLRMATQLDDYWAIRGQLAEARHWLDNALQVAPEPSPERAGAMRLSGWFALLQGDVEVGMTRLGQAGELAEQVGDAAEAAYVTHAWGMGALFIGQLDTAVELLSDALPRFHAAGVRRGQLFGQFSLGITLGMRGDRQRALDVLRDCVSTTEELGEGYWRSYALWAIAHIEVLYDALDVAEPAAREAIRLQWQLDNKLALAFSVDTLAWVLQRRGDPERAATLFGAAAALWRQVGASPGCYVTFEAPHNDHLRMARADLGDERFDTAFQKGYTMPAEAAIDLALGGAAPSRPSAPPTGHQGMPLTRRERQIAELVAEGLSNREIASRLVISPRTAEAHVEHILVKLEFNSRAQIAAWVAEKRSAEEPADE